MIDANKLNLIGISLAVSGIPYGMYLNTLLPITKWSPIIMVLSVLLTMDGRNLIKCKLPNLNTMIRFLIYFHLFMITYYSLYGHDKSFQWLSFHLFVISFCFAIASLPNTFDFTKVPFALFITTIPLVLMGFFICFYDLVVGETASKLRQLDDSFVIEPFTVACGALYNMFAGLCIWDRNKLIKVLVVLFTLVGIYILFSCVKRTPIFVYLVGVAFFVQKSKHVFNINKKRLLINFLFLLIVLICIYITNDFIRVNIDNFVNNMTTGVRNLLGDRSVSDDTGSAIERANNRNTAFNHMSRHWSLCEYIIGNGYFMYWLDSPFLQSYFDMGIMGFVFYIFTVVLYPFRIFRKKNINRMVLFALLLCIYGIVTIFSAGHPYQSEHYVCIILLAVFVNNKNRRKQLFL